MGPVVSFSLMLNEARACVRGVALCGTHGRTLKRRVMTIGLMVIVMQCLTSHSAPIFGGRTEFRKLESIQRGITAKNQAFWVWGG